MSLISHFRVVRFAFQDFYRNFWLSVATISVLVLTLISVNVLLTVNVIGKVALSMVKSKIDVSVHFKPEIDESRVQTIKISLLSMPDVKDVEYVSPAQSLERFSDMYKKDELVLKSLGEVGVNPFGSTLVIKAREIEGYPKIMQALEEPALSEMVEEKDFDDRQALITRIESIAKKIEWFGLGASLIFCLITLLIVFNTIRVSIYTHRDEIRIMRLVGASNSFIRGPFYVEAIIWSVLALGLTLALMYPAISFFQPFVQRFFGTDAVDMIGFYRANYLRVFGSQLAAVALMALITTKMATGRYLRD